MKPYIIVALVATILGGALGGVLTHFIFDNRSTDGTTTKPGVVMVDIGKSKLDSATRAGEIKLVPVIEEQKEIVRRTDASYTLLAKRILELQDSLAGTGEIPMLSASIETTLVRLERFGETDSTIRLTDTVSALVQFVASEDEGSLPVAEWVELSVRHEPTPVKLDTIIITRTISDGGGFFHDAKYVLIGAAVGVTIIKTLDAIGTIGK